MTNAQASMTNRARSPNDQDWCLVIGTSLVIASLGVGHCQTALATKEFERDAGKAFRAVGQRLRNVRLHELTDDQRRENSDAVAKVSQLRGMARKALR